MPSILETLSDDLAGSVDRAAPVVVAIHARRRIPSSGVVWRNGIVVAADHTVQKDEAIDVSLAGGRVVQAQVIGRDPSTDICVLRLEGEHEPAPIDVAPLRVGQLVLAVGRPGTETTATLGLVSAVGPAWR